MAKRIQVGGRIESKEVGGIVTGAAEILDDAKKKKQSVINKETDDELVRLDQSKQDNLTFDNAPTDGSENPVKSGGVYAADKAMSDAIEAILLLIPSAASVLNKLVDTTMMNSSISTATATFRGTYNVVTDLSLTIDATHEQIAAALGNAISTADNNDYAFVQIPVSAESIDIRRTERYKFNGTAWGYEYDLNTSGFTAAQWAAINSGITLALVGKLIGLPTSSELQALLGQKQDTLTFDNVPTAGSANPVKSGGVHTAINDEKTAREQLANTVTGINGRLGNVEEVIPSGAAANNKLVANSSMEAYVTSIIEAITASFTIATADGHINLTLTQTNGQIASLTLTSSDIASAQALTALTGRVTTAEGNITSLGGRVSTNETDIANLQQLYNDLQQSKPEPVTALPETGQQQGVIYRLVGTTSYSDYMWNGSTWVLMATYNNAIDPRPKKASQNLVTSGGVFDNMGALDVSELNATENPHTLAQYVDLSAALAAIPTDYQKGGMSIKFVQSSDNKYVQYRLMSNAFSTTESDWQGVDAEPTDGSQNLVKSGGVYDEIAEFGQKIAATESYTSFSDKKIADLHIKAGQTCKVIFSTTKEFSNLRFHFNKPWNEEPRVHLVVFTSGLGGSFEFVAEEELTSIYAYLVAGGDANLDLTVEVTSSLYAATVTDEEPTLNSLNIVKSNGVSLFLSKSFSEKPKINYNKYVSQGVFADNGGYDCSDFIPLKYGYAFIVKGATPHQYHFYSDNKFDSYIGTKAASDTSIIDSNAKYVIIQFRKIDNQNGYDDFQIASLYDINNNFLNKNFCLPNCMNISESDIEDAYIQDAAFKEFGIKGGSINSKYYISVQNTNSQQRIVVWSYPWGYVQQYALGGIKDTVETVEFPISIGISFKAIIDFSMLGSFDTNKGLNNTPLTTKKVLNTAIFTDEINTNNTLVKDMSSAYTEDEWVNHTNGTVTASNSHKATPYIDVSDINEVCMTLPPIETLAGAAFYDKNKAKLTDFTLSNNLSNVWILVPDGAVYLKACVKDEQTPSLKTKKYVSIPLRNAIQAVYNKSYIIRPLESKIFAPYNLFTANGNPSSARITLTANNNGSGEQIILPFYNRILSHQSVASVLVKDNDSVVSWGNKDYREGVSDDYRYVIEGRAYNKNGSGILEVYRKYGNTDILLGSTDLDFNISNGEYYKVGYVKVDYDTPQGGTSYGSGTFFIEHGTDRSEIEFLYSNTVQYNGVRGDVVAHLVGSPYFGLINGNVEYTNFFVSTDTYNPQVNGMIIGDSFIQGSTLSDGHIHERYAAKLQQAIGMDRFLIAGKGGEEVGSMVVNYLPYLLDKYQPVYLIIALGVNNYDFPTYKAGMKTILNMLNARGIEPILTTVTPRKIGDNPDGLHDVRIEQNNFVKASGYRYVDICKAVTNAAQTEWVSGYVFQDGVHPTVAGHEAIYEAFVKELPELFV